MKKKSPPYAIIGAVVLGVIIIFVYLQHERQIKAEEQANLDKARREMQDEIDKAKAANKPITVVSETPTHMRKVYYATQPIDPGVRLSASFFETKLTPDNVLPDAYTEGPDVDLVGWYAVRNIDKGDPLTPKNVGKELPFMEGRISPGMRAVALKVFFNEPVNNTGGFAVDGDRVDLLMSRTSTDQKLIYDTQTVMQNLKVLFVPGSQIKTDETQGVNPGPAPGGATIVFEVTPEQAQALINLAQVREIKFSMILRSRRDNTEIKIKPFVSYDYFENPKKLQRTTDASISRVQQLQKQIEDAEKKQGENNTTNATPTQPSP